jgi:hypothetical protein
LNFTSTVSSAAIELFQLQLNFISTAVELHFNPGPEMFNRGPRKVHSGCFPQTSLSIPVEPVLGAVQPVSQSSNQSDLLIGRLTVSLTTRRLNRRFNRCQDLFLQSDLQSASLTARLTVGLPRAVEPALGAVQPVLHSQN